MMRRDTTAPHKAAPVEVARGVDVAGLARAALASGCAQVRLNAPGAKRGEDPAFAHQLRVGARRLRVALKLFEALLDESDLARLRHELKWVFSRLGAQRELDVLLRDTLVPLATHDPSPALAALQTIVEAERERRRVKVRHALSSKRFAKLARALDALPAANFGHGGVAKKEARKFARKKLARRREAVLRAYEPALAGDPHSRHQLRKELKKLRYASELTGPVFKGSRVKRYLRTLEDVQEVLGALNDIASGRHQLRLLARGRHVELGPALASCGRHFASEEARALTKLEPLLREHAEAAPFWD